jgi:hypothetical protein
MRHITLERIASWNSRGWMILSYTNEGNGFGSHSERPMLLPPPTSLDSSQSRITLPSKHTGPGSLVGRRVLRLLLVLPSQPLAQWPQLPPIPSCHPQLGCSGPWRPCRKRIAFYRFCRTDSATE